MERIRLWDLPTRLFHWLLVLAVVGAFVTGKMGGNYMVWHGWLGLLIVGLVVFRLVWGVVGSTYARFWSFFPTPKKMGDYFKGAWQGVGHNPLGAFSVFALLGIVIFQLVTGLFADDEISFKGPLQVLVDASLSSRLTTFHRFGVNFLLLLVIVHILAIIFYVHVKKDNLLKPMVTGWKEVQAGKADSARGGGLVAFILAVVLAGVAVWGASGVWIKPPPAPAAVEATPDW